MSTEPEARQVNPIVQKAADQVGKRRRARKSKAKDLPRWECRGQLSLFDSTGDTQ
ncbi:hypothetical protein NONO_c24720 [Nocardia nova SH22a]|uniref:Uncharacterized protein n=1 Tax=Nocardia nova SH22a TaxID=1415166 RepID=W5TE40_9NOCA|nr:hypothetical protein [Nocardia nova]AHH17268.1 hypothetical protein NONO_c24720 [Nocardia nova SH22a]